MPTSKHGYPRPLVLTSGAQVELRLLNPERDGEKLIQFYNRIPRDERWYLLNDVSDEKVVREVILNYDPRLVLPVVAEDENGDILGKATLYRYFPGARGHIARLRVVLCSQGKHQRLGTYMLLDIIQLAVNMGLGLLVAELIRGGGGQGHPGGAQAGFFRAGGAAGLRQGPQGQ